MSHIMMTRRLVAGLRRTAPSPISCLTSTLESLSLSRTSVAPPSSIPRRPTILPLNGHSFSSSAAPKTDDPNSTIVELPPNLKFDPRAKSSPFYGVERVQSEKERRKGLRRKAKKDTEANTAAGSAASTDEESGDERKVGEDGAKSGSEAIDEDEGPSTRNIIFCTYGVLGC